MKRHRHRLGTIGESLRDMDLHWSKDGKMVFSTSGGFYAVADNSKPNNLAEAILIHQGRGEGFFDYKVDNGHLVWRDFLPNLYEENQ